MMKSLLVLIMYLMPCLCLAQKSLDFYYLVHDHNGNELIAVINGVRDSYQGRDDRTVYLYMPDGDTPVYFALSKQEDKRYSTLIDEIRARVSHRVYPEGDRETVCNILSDGFGTFDKVCFNFYITSGFIQQSYCDAVISHLYWDIDLDKFPPGKCQINVFTQKGERIDTSNLFGRKTGNFPVKLGTY